jgi:hypothetical protein
MFDTSHLPLTDLIGKNRWWQVVQDKTKNGKRAKAALVVPFVKRI